MFRFGVKTHEWHRMSDNSNAAYDGPINNVLCRAQRQRVPNIIFSIKIFTVSRYEYIIMRPHTIFAYKSRIIYVSIIQVGRTYNVWTVAIETDRRALITPRQYTTKPPERTLDENSTERK